MTLRVSATALLLLLASAPARGQEGHCVGGIPGLSLLGHAPHHADTLLVETAAGERLSWPLVRDSLPVRITPRAITYERFGLARRWSPGDVRLVGLYRGVPLLGAADDTSSLPDGVLVWAGPPCDFQAYRREPGVGTGAAQALPADRSTLDSLGVVMEYCGDESCYAFRAVLLPGLLRYEGRGDAFPPGRCEAGLPPADWEEVVGGLRALPEDTLAERYGVRLHAPTPTIELYFRGMPVVRVAGGYLPGPLEGIRERVEALVRRHFRFRDATQGGPRQRPRGCGGRRTGGSGSPPAARW